MIISFKNKSIAFNTGLYILLMFLLSACETQTVTQNTESTTKSVGFACSYFGNDIGEKILSGNYNEFASNTTALQVVNAIVEQTGLKPNFIVQESNEVANACALVMQEKRYILYNNQFMEMANNSTRTDWASISILAHEIAHHLQGHTLQKGGSRPEIELEADEYSGYILHKLGASLEDAQKAVSTLISEEGSSSHPGKFKRLEAIQSGWIRVKPTLPPQEEHPAASEPVSETETNSVATEPETREATNDHAQLNLIAIDCLSQEGLVSCDDIYLTTSEGIIRVGEMCKGQRKKINKVIPFRRSTSVEIWDDDLLDEDDQIGTIDFSASQRETNETVIRSFRTAKYRLTYSIEN
jgi:hypothetical protein